jgi:hypothetical protein
MPRVIYRYSIGVFAFGVTFPALIASAQLPDHPIVAEAYCDPPGTSDGPVARLPGNPHQEFIEIYLPPLASLNPALNRDALRLALFEIEGDVDSTGYGLVNYRIDLPTFDLDPSNGINAGAIARPPSGVVVLGWVDYIGNPPTDLAGTPSTRIALINGGITAAADFTFVALNGGQFGGTTNFPIPVAITYINMPSEASSGLIQNGSGVYLLVNRDSAGYVALTDDGDPGGGNHDPSLPTNSVLRTTCLLDGWGPNDSSRFDVLNQPSSDNNNDNFVNLPPGGAFSLLVCQLPENDGSLTLPGTANGYTRKFVDVRRTTETAAADNPIADATTIYRQIRNDGPFFPTPGRVVHTTTPPELSVTNVAQSFTVLAGTTAHPGMLCANVGGNFGINLVTSAGASSNPAAGTFGAGAALTNAPGQSLALAPVAITVPLSAAANAASSATVTVTATNTNGADPAVIAPVQNMTAIATVLKPTTGMNAGGGPFQATIFAAIQPILAGPAANEFAGTSLAQWVAPRLGSQAQDTWGNGSLLLNAATDISDPLLIRPLVRDFPTDEGEYVNPPGPPGRLDLVQTVLQSAEVASGTSSYDEIFNGSNSALRGTRVNTTDTLTFGGAFTPSEGLYFFDAAGRLPSPTSGLFNATTTRTFELAMIDTNVTFSGALESGATDDVGLVVQVLDVETGSPVVPGEFVFLSFSGGLQGADLDGTQALPGQNVVANILYFDLDNLHDVLGVRTIELMWLIDAGGATNEIDPMEAFSLNPAGVVTPCPGDLNGDQHVDLADLATLLAHFGTPGGATLADGDLDADGDVDLADLASLLSNFGAFCP